MTATTSVTPSTSGPAGWRQVARLQVRPWGLHNFGWFWVVIAMVAIAVTVVTAIVTEEVTQSVWNWLLEGPRYYLLAMSIMMTLQLSTYVGHGVTRRDTLLGLQVFLAVASVAFGLMTVLYFGIEAVVFNVLGWGRDIGLDRWFTSSTDVAGILAQTIPTHLAWCVSGPLITLTYQRWGALRGTVALPLVLLPGMGVQWLFSAGNPDRGWDLALGLGLPAVLGIALVLILLGGLATHAVVHELEVRTRHG